MYNIYINSFTHEKLYHIINKYILYNNIIISHYKHYYILSMLRLVQANCPNINHYPYYQNIISCNQYDNVLNKFNYK